MLNKKRAINASETGLGKTVEAIASAEKLKELKLVDHCIVFCLKSLKLQWAKRIREFTDSSYLIVEGSPTKRLAQLGSARNYFYILFNYEQTHKNIKQIWDILDKAGRERLVIVCDEVTKIKNYKSKTAVRIKTLWAKWMWALTATPVENRPDELFSIVDWLDPKLFGSWYKFDGKYIARNPFGGIAYYHNLDDLSKIVQPIVKKDTREQVKDQLPQLSFKQYDVELYPEEKRIYNIIREDLMKDLDVVIDARELQKEIETGEQEVDDIEKALVMLSMGITGQQFQILAKFLCLRMICCHPYLLKNSSSKYAVEKFNEQPPMYNPDRGSKLDVTMEVLETLLKEPNSKIVIFTFFTRMIDILVARIETIFPDIKLVKFIGPMSAKQRLASQEAFNTDKDVRIILCSDAGGYGVDLPAGNYLINYDLPWHFGKLDQRNRIQRLISKHTHNVIINIVVANSVEERMMELIERKRTLSNIIVDGRTIPEEVSFRLNKMTLRKFLEERGKL
jgi:SNF2 family DNA or RNA helicase